MQTYFAIAFASGFFALWVGVHIAFARMGGWAELAKCYPDRRNEKGTTFYMQSGGVGFVNYGSCLNLRICKYGLRLSVFPMFRIGHPPIFIPWNQFHRVFERREMLFFQFVDTCVGNPVVADVKLPAWMADVFPVQVLSSGYTPEYFYPDVRKPE